jgi:hypothetical protein
MMMDDERRFPGPLVAGVALLAALRAFARLSKPLRNRRLYLLLTSS